MRAVLSTVPKPDDDDGAQWIETVSQYVTAGAEWNEEVTKSRRVFDRPSGLRTFPVAGHFILVVEGAFTIVILARGLCRAENPGLRLLRW